MLKLFPILFAILLHSTFAIAQDDFGFEQVVSFDAGDLIWYMAWSPTDEILAIATLEEILLWNTESDEVVHLRERYRGNVSFAWNPDGTLLASNGGCLEADEYGYCRGGAGLIHIWNVRTNQIAHTLEFPEGLASALIWTPDGSQLISVQSDNSIRFWDTDTWLESDVWEIVADRIEMITLNPDGNLLAVAETQTERESQVSVYNIATGQMVMALGDEYDFTSWIQVLAWSPADDFIVGGITEIASRGYLTIWDRTTSDIVNTLPFAHVIAFSPNGEFLATTIKPNDLGEGDETDIRIWDMAGNIAATLEGHIGPVLALDWSPDGAILASGGQDNTVRLWEVSR